MNKISILALALVAGCGSVRTETVPVSVPASTENVVAFLNDSITTSEIARRVSQFAPARLDFNDAPLAVWEKQVLVKLVEASRIMHDIYTIQVSPQNPAWRARLEKES